MAWIGVDLDGTLAVYEGWVGEEYIGPPIEKMAARIRAWVSQGIEVRILTARVDGFKGELAADKAREAIEKWCLIHLGFTLPITCSKDMRMIELWDDRAVQVIPNTGIRADGKE